MSENALVIDAGIIAGGMGSRLDGADKGLLEWDGAEFALHIVNRLRPHTRKLVINCNRNSQHYWPLADLVVSDGDEAFNGPLAGLRSLMLASNADYLLVSPCDTPALPEDYAERMFACLESHPGATIAVDDGVRLHPLHLLVPVSLADSITEYLANGERRMMKWLKQNNLVCCDFSDQPDGFLNVNTPKEMQLLLTQKGC
ncbi:molybdenum cofactor guanylyltransferase MobA [Alkalimarinus alittae]|uniref:Molybdenum cofactor guanylyltransferase n=1 Tax=Alkalimarinus alittae TaxID=2961619 RepID=A0ABY6N2V2_9ALTE|nr:molybdenum cofactor guanylyltransferase MobA [Alkalimarinus alittae]UZE96440.1 molybdenum cofactor guanylyltransferase [Alkalimarinus alittae]